MKITVFFTIITILNGILAREDIKNCNQASTYNYGYDKFYQITDGATHENGTLQFAFKVKSKSDAHILLSSSSDTPTTDILAAYEIVIGGGKNTFSQIRMLKKGAKATETIPNLLSEYEYRGFWISVNRTENIIMVGKENVKEPFLFWKNPQWLPIKYFSFGSWVNVKAEWLFGCPDEDDPEFVEVETNYTGQQRLRKDLLTLYDPFSVPNELDHLLVVKISFLFHNIHLNEKEGQMSVDGLVNLMWNDEKLKWNPEDYDGIDIQYLRAYHVWTPNLKVLSGLQYTDIIEFGYAGLTVKSNGNVFWRPEVHFSTYCTLNIKYWPHDVHNCSFNVGFRNEPENLIIDLQSDSKSIAEDRTGSEWDIIDVVPYNWVPDEQSGVKGSAVGVINITLRRRDQSYRIILLTPFFCAGIMVLASFWIDPDHSGQLFLCCGNLVILTVMFIAIGDLIPAKQEQVPNIVLLYSWGMILTCVPLLLTVCLKNLSERIRLPGIIVQILNSNVAKFLCVFPSSSQDQTIYSKLKENQQEQEKHNEVKIHLLKFAVAIERVFFIWYLILFASLTFFCNKY